MPIPITNQKNPYTSPFQYYTKKRRKRSKAGDRDKRPESWQHDCTVRCPFRPVVRVLVTISASLECKPARTNQFPEAYIFITNILFKHAHVLCCAQ